MHKLFNNMTLSELLREAAVSQDPLVKRLAAYLEVFEGREDKFVYPHEIEYFIEDFESTIEEKDSENRNLMADLDDLDTEKRALNTTINSLRYELNLDLRVKEIDALRNNIMELSDRNMDLIRDKNKINNLYLELVDRYEDLEKKWNTWNAISKDY